MALLVSICMTVMGIYRMHPNMQALMQSLNDVGYSTAVAVEASSVSTSTTTTTTTPLTATTATTTSTATTSTTVNTGSTAAVASTTARAVEEASLRGGSTASTTTTPDSSEIKPSVGGGNPAAATAPAATSSTTNTETETKASSKPKEANAAAAPKPPMNIVLFYADDWTYKTLGLVNDYVKTPNLDQLAKEGVLFTHNCVTTSICMQSRATLYTGQYVSRHQTLFSWRNVTMYEPERWKQTLYPLMLNSGYHVGFVGKYHHLEPPPGPTFDYFVSEQMNHYPRRGSETRHVTAWNEHDAKDFLSKRPKEKPFFLTVSYFATHAEDGNIEGYRPMESSTSLYEDQPVPLPKTFTEQHWKQLPPFFNDENFGRGRFRNRYDTPETHQIMMKKLYRMATEVDAACGNIIQVLKEQGVYDNTLIVFTTDNGNFHGEHGLAEKWYAYEESLRVPLIIKDPRMPADKIGTANDDFTLNIDLAPTILSAAKVQVPDVMQGRDMSALYLTPEPKWRRDFFYEFYYDIPYYIPHSIALVGQGFKYIYWLDHNYPQFFNLTTDPYEEFDLMKTTAAVDPALLEQVQRRLTELKASVEQGLPQ
jgi:arylsulfatase